MINELEHYEHLVEFLYDVFTDRNIETVEHIKYVQGYTEILVNEYARLFPESNMTKKKREMIIQASQFHDIGKVMIPDSVLNKSGRLSESELEILMTHTAKGGKIISLLFDFMEEDFIEICRNICVYHHEKYDGTGHPAGIKSDDIPVEAQIVALADMYNVLMHTEIKGGVFSKEKVYYMLMNGECGELSPEMKECLQSAKESLESLS